MINAKNGLTVLNERSQQWIPFLLLFTIIYSANLCQAVVRIHELLVPRFLENGSQPEITLDCVYTLDEEEDRNLVVKWFLNEDPEPIYQWIPEFDSRHASRRWEDRISIDYAVNTDNPLTKYRAVNIKRPTTDLSGVYSCHVMSLKSQDSKETTMIVYAPPRVLEFNYSKEPPRSPAAAFREEDNGGEMTRSRYGHSSRRQSSVPLPSASSSSSSSSGHGNEPGERRKGAKSGSLGAQFKQGAILTCDIREVYPIPEVVIYRINSDGTNPLALTVIDTDIQKLSTTAYSVRVSSIVSDYDLLTKFGDEPSIFECLVTLQLQASKKLVYKRRILYFPDVVDLSVTNGAVSGQCPRTSFSILLVGLAFSLSYLDKKRSITFIHNQSHLLL